MKTIPIVVKFFSVRFITQFFNLLKISLFLFLLPNSDYAYYASTIAICQLFSLISSLGVSDKVIIACNSPRKYSLFVGILPYYLTITLFICALLLLPIYPFIQPQQSLFTTLIILLNAICITFMRYLNNLSRYMQDSKTILFADTSNIVLTIVLFFLFSKILSSNLGFSAFLSSSLSVAIVSSIYFIKTQNDNSRHYLLSNYTNNQILPSLYLKILKRETIYSISLYILNILMFISSMVIPIFLPYIISDNSRLGLLFKVFTFANIFLTLIAILSWSFDPIIYSQLRTQLSKKILTHFYNIKLLLIPSFLSLVILFGFILLCSTYHFLPDYSFLQNLFYVKSFFFLLIISVSDLLSWHSSSYLNVSNNIRRRILYQSILLLIKLSLLFFLGSSNFIVYLYFVSILSNIVNLVIELREYPLHIDPIPPFYVFALISNSLISSALFFSHDALLLSIFSILALVAWFLSSYSVLKIRH